MTERRERTHAAAAGLRAAIMAMPIGERPLNQSLPLDGWHDLGRLCIAAWVDDAARCCDRIALALDAAARERDEEALDALESALWRVDAAREKLEAVLALALGVPSLMKYRKGTVRFEPDTRRLRARLRELGSQHEAAKDVLKLGEQLARHPAVLLRNQLSHQIAPIWEARELCWIDVAHVRGQSIIGWTGGPFYVEGLLERTGGIGSETLWKETVGEVEKCFDLLVKCLQRMKELVEVAAVLEPPQRVYRYDESGELALSDPRFSDCG